MKPPAHGAPCRCINGASARLLLLLSHPAARVTASPPGTAIRGRREEGVTRVSRLSSCVCDVMRHSEKNRSLSLSSRGVFLMSLFSAPLISLYISAKNTPQHAHHGTPPWRHSGTAPPPPLRVFISKRAIFGCPRSTQAYSGARAPPRGAHTAAAGLFCCCRVSPQHMTRLHARSRPAWAPAP